MQVAHGIARLEGLPVSVASQPCSRGGKNRFMPHASTFLAAERKGQIHACMHSAIVSQ
jgi:hypothetical protein